MPDDEKFREFYAHEASVYEETRYRTKYGRLFRKLHHAVLVDMLAGLPADARCLEVACGTGHTTGLLARHFNALAACDLTPEMMLLNQRSNAGANVTYLQANAFSLPFPDSSVDVLVSTRFLHLFARRDQQRLYREFNRVLVPGGRLIIDFDNIIARWIHAIPHLLYNLVRYRRLAPFSIYNFPGRTRNDIDAAGFGQLSVQGVGGWHLLLPAMVSGELALELGAAHRSKPLLYLAEQFVVSGVKRKTP